MTPLIDADILIWEVGFGSERKEDQLGPEGVEKVVIPRSWEEAQNLFDQKVDIICKEVEATEPPILFLSENPTVNRILNKQRKYKGEAPLPYISNFREAIAVTKGYKANRTESVKPFHYKNLLNYVLSDRWNWRVAPAGLEADDAMAIYQVSMAKEFGVKMLTHAGEILLDYEDWLKHSETTFIKESKGYFVNDTGKGDTRKVWYLHREIMGNPEGFVIDHVNGDKKDNRKYNLRKCSTQENIWNSKPQEGSSKYKGVCWDRSRNKWTSHIKVDRQSIHLGRYDVEEDAAKAYDEAAKKHYGQFARLNLESPYHKPFVETIICSRDKDLKQCPLKHYSWECYQQPSLGPLTVSGLGKLWDKNEGLKYPTGKPKPVNIIGTGDLYFYYQMITGDRTDNIVGINKLGPVFAYKLLKDATTALECYTLTSEVYKERCGNEWEIMYEENAGLLWIVKEVDENGGMVSWTKP